MDLKQAYKILEIPETATIPEIKQAYRDLVQIWHPDRHPQNERLQSKAQEKMKEINAAFEFISSYLGTEGATVSSYEESKPKSSTEAIIPCPQCSTKNRVPHQANNSLAKCGKCGSFLFQAQHKRQSGTQWERRTLCGDGACIGIIDSMGRCTECGRTYEEGIAADKDRMERKRQQQPQEKSTSRSKKTIIYTVITAVFSLLLLFLNSSHVPSDKKNGLQNSPVQGSSKLESPIESERMNPDRIRTGSPEYAGDIYSEQSSSSRETKVKIDRTSPSETRRKSLEGIKIDYESDATQYVIEMINNARDEKKLASARDRLKDLPKPQKGDKIKARKLNAEALDLMKQSRDADAIPLLEYAHGADPSDVEITNNLASAYFNISFTSNDFTKSKSMLVDTLAINPERNIAWANLGRLFAMEGNDLAAANCYINYYIFSKNKEKALQSLHANINTSNTVLSKASIDAYNYANMLFIKDYNTLKSEIKPLDQIPQSNSAGTIPPDRTELSEKSITTKSGTISVERRQKEEPPSTLWLNDQIIFMEEGSFLNIERKFSFKDRDVVLLSVNSGGSGGFIEYAFIILRQKTKPVIVRNANFMSEDGTFIPRVAKGGTIIVDLGYLRGLRKFAKLEGETLTIDRTAEGVRKEPIAREACEVLYDYVLEDVIERGINNLSNASQSWVDSLEHNPNFDNEGFKTLCVSVRKAGKKPPKEEFERRFCDK